MNFLAHLHLAAPTDASRIGNLLGDFAKGTPDSLRERLPAEVVRGIVMHRSLDVFTDRHPAFRRARDLLSPERRRFAGVVIDVVFDHFLAVQWESFAPQPLDLFIAEIHAALDRHPEWLGPELTRILPRMKNENWLHSYGSLEGLDCTFRRISRRSPRTGPIAGSAADLADHYATFERFFRDFYPDAQAEARRILAT